MPTGSTQVLQRHSRAELHTSPAQFAIGKIKFGTDVDELAVRSCELFSRLIGLDRVGTQK